jgi:hypothetical protein
MLSPHTSYPVLEMAACGGITVTNSFSSKTAERFAALSPNIVAVPPTSSTFAAGLIDAAGRITDGAGRKGQLALPASWDESLAGVQRLVQAMFAES